MVLKSVGLLSAGKLMGAMGVLSGLILGGILTMVSILGVALQNQQGAANQAMPAVFLGAGALIFVPIFYGIFGFITGLLYALFYNIVAGFVGGLELNLQPHSSQNWRQT